MVPIPICAKGGLRLDVLEDALRGGDSGEPAIVPGMQNEVIC